MRNRTFSRNMNGVKFLSPLLLILFFSCATPFDRLSQIEGKWVGMQDGNEFAEVWTRTSDNKYAGIGAGLMNGDTIFKEKLSIEQMGEEIFYIANPNEEGPINFRLVESQDDIFTFENKEHDFPQQIVYSFARQDTLLIQLMGQRDGRDAIEQLMFMRSTKK